jgi:nitrate reductase beta subunit
VLVEGFEASTLPLGRFHHREHLRVAIYYLSRDTEAGATSRIRQGLKRLLAHHGIDGYHETLTVFWMKVLAARLAKTDPRGTLDERIEEVIAWCLAEQPVAQYYSPETLASSEARQVWVPPDLRTLEF